MQTGDLRRIKELTEQSVELLSAVGVEGLVALAESDALGLYEEVKQANGHLELVKQAPSQAKVEGWVKQAGKITGKKPKPAPIQPVQSVKESVSVSSLPVALTLSKEAILKNSIQVGDVPVMENFVSEDELAAKVSVKKEQPRKPEDKAVRKEQSVSKKKPLSQKQIPVSKEKSVGQRISPTGLPPLKSAPLGAADHEEDDGEMRPRVEPLKRNDGFDIRKTPSAKLNEGRKLHSRRFVRGVLHPQAGRVKVAAMISIMTLLLIPASFVAGGLLIFKEFVSFEVSLWVLSVPVAFLFFGFLYIVIVKPMKCRICGQPLLGSKSCFRHVKAHRRPFLGYIFPTSLHMLLFHWYRCIYCGTSVRMKE